MTANPLSAGNIDMGPVVVTGAAGFIGSHLTEALLHHGIGVAGIDRCPVDDPIAAPNLATTLQHPLLRLRRADIAVDDLDQLVTGAGTVFHLAAVPGVRESWGEGFSDYVASNIVAVQRLLAAAERVGVTRFVLASSSSVYGPTKGPSRESDATRPLSPYGVTKVAAEDLCLAHAARSDTDMSVVVLRYFTVYGPRQRPSMAISRVLDAALTGREMPLYGDGRQRREFTYVDDVVDATLAAATVDGRSGGVVVNVGGGSSVTMLEVIGLASDITGRRVHLRHEPAQAGDVEVTEADSRAARKVLGWQPTVTLGEGMGRQWEWMTTQPAAVEVVK